MSLLSRLLPARGRSLGAITAGTGIPKPSLTAPLFHRGRLHSALSAPCRDPGVETVDLRWCADVRAILGLGYASAPLVPGIPNMVGLGARN
ncbi:hypothetical protein GCM10009827_062700 [Dactylosporangium maewongense]|uniref:Uncharacterized protein n=1 Tax=Dactylosporangium maewongense TaxID=634393 RepID=A0ABP4M3I0_9ACTN